MVTTLVALAPTLQVLLAQTSQRLCNLPLCAGPDLQVIGDRTDGLVNLLLEKFRPGVTSATDGLSLTATQKIMEQVKAAANWQCHLGRGEVGLGSAVLPAVRFK